MQVIDFHPDLAPAFKDLNLAWITRYFAVEPKDMVALGDPQGQIIDKGGQVIFVVDEAGQPAGCVALLPLADGGFEVGKMAASDAHKGKGVGHLLIQACIDRAKAAGAPRLYLETNDSLAPALAVYRRAGFVEITDSARTVSPYARANVWMELVF